MIYDFTIVGAGGAGLSLALMLQIKYPSAKICILCKTYPMGSHTTAAKGGINASLGNIIPDDTKWHIYDTITSGKGLCDEIPVEKMCNLAPSIIEFLTNIGVEFDTTPNGKIDQRIYGGQTTHFGNGTLANRACFVKDHTGHSIMEKIHEEVQKQKNITVFNYTQAIDLIQDELNHVVIYNIEKGSISTVSANIVIFATGGFSQIYKTTSTSSLCTGCGHRILFQNGFQLKDIEFVQFHPTGLKNSGILISEACRSQGAYLLNNKGERFMEKIHKLKELAPRDIIAKAIDSETKNGQVFLDLRHIPKDIILSQLISSYTVAKYFAGIDISQDLLPIEPTAHYNMGGILVDENYYAGRNVYAIGELACASVHGANRLGCNSLLELFTSAKIVADDIANKYKINNSQKISKNIDLSKYLVNNSNIKYDEIFALQERIKNIMQKNALICKNEEGLQNALEEIEIIYNKISKLNNFSATAFDIDFITLFETQSLTLMARCVLQASIARKHSIGSHFREDFPTFPENPQHSILNFNDLKTFFNKSK